MIKACQIEMNVQTALKIVKSRNKDRRLKVNIKKFIAHYGASYRPQREETLSVEVVIPCYNHGSFVVDALSSVPRDVSVVIVNDNSTDDTAEVLDRLSRNYRFRVLTNEANLNQSGSINRAVATSEANCFVVLNADDLLTNGWIDHAVAYLNANRDVRLVGGFSFPFDGEQRRVVLEDQLKQMKPLIEEWTVYFPSHALKYTLPNSLNMTMSGCTFLKSAWETVDGFWPFERRVVSFDDRDFQMRVSAIFPVAVSNGISAFYRRTSSTGKGRE